MGPISYYICIYFIINHQSSLITHQSSVINHQSSIISYQSSIIHDQWSIISHQLPVINFFSTFCDQLSKIHKNTHTSSKHKKERAQKVIPGGTKKKESSAKSLNDIKKSKRKSANMICFGGRLRKHVPRNLGFPIFWSSEPLPILVFLGGGVFKLP